MQTTSLSTNMTVFLIFFAGSTLDAFVTRSWWRAAFWMAIALVFLGADRMSRRRRQYDRAEQTPFVP